MVFFHPTLPTPTPITQTFHISLMSAHAPYSDTIMLVSLSLILMPTPTLTRPSYSFLPLLTPPMATYLSKILLCHSSHDLISVPSSVHVISLPSSHIPCQPHPFLVYFLFLYRSTSLLSCIAFPSFISLPLCPSLVHLYLPCICCKLF